MQEHNRNGTATSYRSATISPKTLVFSVTIQAGLSLPIEDGEKPEDALARVDNIVKAAVTDRLNDALQMELQDPRVQGQTEAYRAVKEGRPSNHEALKETHAPEAAPPPPARRTPARRTPTG